jgi:GT2 family glycosyltransferase
MPKPTVSVIIVTWNVKDLLLRTLARLPAACAPFTWETIVVDNASSDGSNEAVAAAFPATRYLYNDTNPGYAKGNNQGLALAQGDFLLLLNPDTAPDAGALACLVSFLQAHPAVGMVGPALVLPDGSPQPYAFGSDPTPVYLLRRNIKRLARRGPLHDWGAGQAARVDWVSGACLLARREVYAQIGGLDEAMFMYFEDNDWCLRGRQAGWEVWREPAARVVHVGGQSLKQNRRAPAAYYASLRTFYQRHYGAGERLALALLLRLLPRSAR